MKLLPPLLAAFVLVSCDAGVEDAQRALIRDPIVKECNERTAEFGFTNETAKEACDCFADKVLEIRYSDLSETEGQLPILKEIVQSCGGDASQIKSEIANG